MMEWDLANDLDKLYRVYPSPLALEEVARGALLLVTILRARMVPAVAATVLAAPKVGSNSRSDKSLSRCLSHPHSNLAGQRPPRTGICATANEHRSEPMADVDGACKRVDGSKDDGHDDHDQKPKHIIIGSERVFHWSSICLFCFPCFICVREWVPRGIFDEYLTNLLLLPGMERDGWNEKHSTLLYSITIITTKIYDDQTTVISLAFVHFYISSFAFQGSPPEGTITSTIVGPRICTAEEGSDQKFHCEEPPSFGRSHGQAIRIVPNEGVGHERKKPKSEAKDQLRVDHCNFFQGNLDAHER